MKFNQLLVLFLLSISVFGQAFENIGENELPKDIKINCFTQDEYALWLGCDAGIYRLEFDENGRVSDLSHRKTSRPVIALLNDGGKLWSALVEKGLYLFDKKTYQFKSVQERLIRGNDIVFLKKGIKQLQLLSNQGKVFQILLQDTTGIELVSPNGVIFESIQNRMNNVAKNDFMTATATSFNYRGVELKNIPFNLSNKKVFLDKTALIAVGSDLWKLDTLAKQFLKCEFKGNFVGGEFYELNSKQVFISEKGLVKYDQTKDTLKAAQNVADKIIKPLVSTVEQSKEELSEATVLLNEKEEEENNIKSLSCDNNTCSIGWVVGVVIGLILYSLILVWLVSRKYKKDIYTIEEELLSIKKSTKKRKGNQLKKT